MFITKNKVHMHDTDMVGIIFFTKQFRFAHEAIEEIFEKEDLGFGELILRGEYLFVIVHAEADYIAPLKIGDALEVRLWIEKLGVTSVTFRAEIYKEQSLCGTVSIVKVCLDPKTWKKAPLPPIVKERFSKYLKN